MEIVNLKKVTTDTNVNYFVVVGLTKDKYEEIKEDINKSYSYIDTKVQNEEYREFNKHILFIGDLDRYPYTSKIVYKYKKNILKENLYIEIIVAQKNNKQKLNNLLM